MIKTLVINSLTIGQGSSYYSIKEAQGFGTAEVQVVRFERPGFHGSKVPRAYYRARVMRLRIGVRSTTVSDYAARRRALLKAFDLPRDGLTTMQVNTSEELALQCQVQLNGGIEAPLLSGEVTMGEMWVSLIAPDPLFYSQTETTTDVTFADGTGIVANSGDAPIFPTVRIAGQLTVATDIVVQNSTLGRTVSLTALALGEAEYASINMEDETVVKNDSSNLYSYIDEDDFWWILEGNNTINISGTTGASGDRKITLTYRLGYLGV
jgi:hypothetical protein